MKKKKDLTIPARTMKKTLSEDTKEGEKEKEEGGGGSSFSCFPCSSSDEKRGRKEEEERKADLETEDGRKTKEIKEEKQQSPSSSPSSLQSIQIARSRRDEKEQNLDRDSMKPNATETQKRPSSPSDSVQDVDETCGPLTTKAHPVQVHQSRFRYSEQNVEITIDHGIS